MSALGNKFKTSFDTSDYGKFILLNLELYFVILMVKLKLRGGPKGQIVLPKIVRDKLGIKPRSYVIAGLKEDELTLQRGPDIEDLLS